MPTIVSARRRARCAGALLCACILTLACSETGGTPDTQPRSRQLNQPPTWSTGSLPDRLYLVYDEQKIGDEARAAVYALAARSVPRDKWPEVEAEQGQYLWGVASKYALRARQGALEQTKSVLVEEMQKANAISTEYVPTERSLRFPPVPVRGFSTLEYAETYVGTYRPMTQGYADAGREARAAALPLSNVAAVGRMEELSTRFHKYDDILMMDCPAMSVYPPGRGGGVCQGGARSPSCSRPRIELGWSMPFVCIRHRIEM